MSADSNKLSSAHFPGHVLARGSLFRLKKLKKDNQVVPNSYSATITWVTDKPPPPIEYGDGSSLTSKTEEDINLVVYTKFIFLTLSRLLNTIIGYQQGCYGNEAKSNSLTFVTLKEPPQDQPPQISDIERTRSLPPACRIPATCTTRTTASSPTTGCE